MNLEEYEQTAAKDISGEIPDTAGAGDLSNAYNMQESDPTGIKIRRAAEDLKTRLRELLISRFLS
ncbi:MAG: hypothetical protein AAGF01_00025 [Cyanobacteria bacterium P01_G01_bin.38]